MVLAGKDHIAGEVDQPVIHGCDGFQVQMVRGLIQHEEIGSGEHHAAEHAADLLTAGEHADRLVHIVPAEEHAAEEAAHVGFQLFRGILGEPLHHVQIAPVEELAVILGEIAGGNGHAPFHGAAVRLDFLRENAEERGLGLLVAHQGDLLALGHEKRDILQQLHAVLGIVQVRYLQDVLACLPVGRKGNPGIAAAGGRHLLDGQLVQELPAAGSLLGLGLVAGKALDERLQLPDLILPAFLLVVHERLHHLAGFVPEIIVADIELDLVVVDIHNMGTDVVQEPAVMADHDQRAREFHEEILKPGDGAVVQVVGRLVQQEDVRISEQRLGQQHLELVAGLELAHHHGMFFRGNSQPRQQGSGVAFRVPAVHFGKLAFQLRGLFAVRLAEVRLGVQRVFLFHDVIKPLVAHDDRIQDGIGVIHELILLQRAHPLRGRDGNGTGGRFQLSAQNFQEGGFAGAVGADNAVAVSGQEFQIRPGKEFLASESQRYIAYCNHLIDLLTCRLPVQEGSPARRISALAKTLAAFIMEFRSVCSSAWWAISCSSGKRAPKATPCFSTFA